MSASPSLRRRFCTPKTLGELSRTGVELSLFFSDASKANEDGLDSRRSRSHQGMLNHQVDRVCETSQIERKKRHSLRHVVGPQLIGWDRCESPPNIVQSLKCSTQFGNEFVGRRVFSTNNSVDIRCCSGGYTLGALNDGSNCCCPPTESKHIRVDQKLRGVFVLPAHHVNCDRECGDRSDSLYPRSPLRGVEPGTAPNEDQVRSQGGGEKEGQNPRRVQPTNQSCHLGILAC